MRALFRILVCLLPLAALAAAKPEGLGFDLGTSNGLARAASIYIAPVNALFYWMRFPDGHYYEFENLDAFSTASQQRLVSSNGWSGGLRKKEGLIQIKSSTNGLGGQIEFFFQHGKLIKLKYDGKEYHFPYGTTRRPTDGGPPEPIYKGGGTGDKFILNDFSFLRFDKDGNGIFSPKFLEKSK